MYVYRIKKLFPQAQYIHIIRDGVDVTYSYVNTGLYNNYLTAALRWKGAVNFLQKFGKQNSEQYYEIKYEDLVTKPKAIVQRICTFLDITFEKEMLTTTGNFDKLGDVKYQKHHKNIYNNINENSIGKGRENISKEALVKIAPVLNKTLDNFGYNKILKI